MTKIVLDFSRELAELYDKVFDYFYQNETSFTHALIRALTGFNESHPNELKQRIHDKLIEWIGREAEATEIYEREILVDKVTVDWLKMVQKQSPDVDDSLESVFLTGVVILSIMVDIHEKDGNAALATSPSPLALQQIIHGRPQCLH